MVKFEATKQELENISKICDRAERSKLIVRKDRLTLLMDLEATHSNGNPMDFEKLLAFDDFNFAHDVLGISNSINRNTGELMNCFLPRSSK